MKNDMKDRLRAGECLIGAWLQTSSATNAEVMASCGFDWLAIDMEHGTAGLEQAASVFAVAEVHGVTPLVRLPSADPYLARQLLDAGARGMMVPVVEDATDFAEFVAHCIYPPNGKRGVGLVRASLWGGSFEDYLRTFQPVIVPMIETSKGVAAANDIAAIDHVDGIFLGPYDLSADLDDAGNFEMASFREAIQTVQIACERHGKALGIHQVEPEPAALRDRKEQGFKMIAYGTDVIAIRHAFADLKTH
jgi:2-dehydro-3-deoxyglucarate aldolase